jgi:hypothetical protein
VVRVNVLLRTAIFLSYQVDTIVSPLVRQLPWSHNLIILNQTKVTPLVSQINAETMGILKIATGSRFSIYLPQGTNI